MDRYNIIENLLNKKPSSLNDTVYILPSIRILHTFKTKNFIYLFFECNYEKKLSID